MYQPIPSTDKQPSSQPQYAASAHNQAQYVPQQPYQQQHQQYTQHQAPTPAQYQQPPYAQPVYASVVYTLPPRRSALQRYASRLGMAFLLVLLNLVNLVFSIGMFAVVMVGVSLTVGLLPVACLGLVVLNLFVCFVHPISALDGWLYSQRQRLYQGLMDDN